MKTPSVETTLTLDGKSRRHLVTAMAVAPLALGVTSSLGATTPTTKSNGKVAIVTGSSRGIGAATAKRLAREGYAVTVNCEKNRDLAAAVVADIEAAGGQAIWVQADVSDPKAVAKLFDACEKKFGGVDAVIANAGIMHLGEFSQLSDAEFDRMWAVNGKGSFNTLREASRRVRDGGRIISFSSSITQLRTATYGPYAASKMAQDMFVGSLAKELAGRHISVNAIAPGVVNTTLFTNGKTEQQIAAFAQRTPYKRLGEPEDIADVIAALCGEKGAWVNGQTVFANGGLI
jgi:3-oxoacyl-[acyl-carrier protein] reductase